MRILATRSGAIDDVSAETIKEITEQACSMKAETRPHVLDAADTFLVLKMLPSNRFETSGLIYLVS